MEARQRENENNVLNHVPYRPAVLDEAHVTMITQCTLGYNYIQNLFQWLRRVAGFRSKALRKGKKKHLRH